MENKNEIENLENSEINANFFNKSNLESESLNITVTDEVVESNPNKEEQNEIFYEDDGTAELVMSYEDIPKSTPPDDEKSVIDLIRQRIRLSGYVEIEQWTTDHALQVQDEFVTSDNDLLVAYMHSKNGLQLDTIFPTGRVNELVYFIKRRGYDFEIINAGNFHDFIQHGTVCGRGIDSLLRIMMGIYAPSYFANTMWPDSIKNDFSLQLQRFMSALTDARWKLEGKTVLYIPAEAALYSVENGAKEKDFINRMEMIMIHWTRQIKEVLSAQNAFEDTESSGPLDEIEYWKNRCDDLSGISKQLDKTGVKHITKILETAKSSYVGAFLKLASEIKFNTQQAQSNLKFLNTLKDMCHDLSDSKPEDIPSMLSKLINRIRMIWVNSEHYNSRDAMTGMFRKMSNEIIKRCCLSLDLDEIFDGQIVSSMKKLQNCIYCCEQYKEIYDKICHVHKTFSNKPWNLDKTNIFAQIDAFIQRCKDLIEICECQAHFARFEDGNKKEMPIFQGARGAEVEMIILQIETVFENNIRALRDRKSTILDVKATSWHDDYNRFRSGVKDLEVMTQNAITTAFETVTTIQQGIEILDVFAHLQNRETIRRTTDKMTQVVCNKLMQEFNLVKKELALSTSIGLPHPSIPKYAGIAIWARTLRKRIERQMLNLDQAFFLPISSSNADFRQQYTQLSVALEEVVRKTHIEFMSGLDRDPLKSLDVTLLSRSTISQGMLDINFSRALLKLFQELHYWERLQFDIPHYAADIYIRRTELRISRESVLLVVRDYNRILQTLNAEERSLFKEQIKTLDKKIQPGLTKILWSSKGAIEYFVNDCRINAARLQKKVDEYKTANDDIRKYCELISSTLMIKIDSNRIYENTEFNDSQEAHRAVVKEKLIGLHGEIINQMRETYEIFSKDSSDIQQYWNLYMNKVDKFCEEAFRLNVKYSLNELNKAINGDGRNEPSPLFKVSLNLQMRDLVFIPTLPELTNIVTSLGKNFIEVVKEIPRIGEILQKVKLKKSIWEFISTDDEITKIQTNIRHGMQDISSAIQEPLGYWDQFREIWELNKEEFISQYCDLNPHVYSIDADISRYTEVTNKALDAEAMVTVKFLQLDFSMLKNSIAAHCRDWQQKLTNLLLAMATKSLMYLHNYMLDMSEKVSKIPQNLEELGESMRLLDKLNEEKNHIQEKFHPLDEHFIILDKYEVQYSEDIHLKKQNLEKEWQDFLQALVDAEQMIKKSKDKFKTGLLVQSDDFKKQVSALIMDFQTNGPFSASIPPQEALAKIANFKSSLESLKIQEQEIRRGLNLFKIEQPPSKEIAALEKTFRILLDNMEKYQAQNECYILKNQNHLNWNLNEETDSYHSSFGVLWGIPQKWLEKQSIIKCLDQFEELIKSVPYISILDYTLIIDVISQVLYYFHVMDLDHITRSHLKIIDLDNIENIWKLALEWETNWTQWKSGKFIELKTGEMENLANSSFRKATKFSRDLKEKNWEIIEYTKNRVDQFRRTMPLITDLRNEAMRDRHWFQIKNEIRKQFDEESSDFTLEKIIDLNFDQHAEMINEVSGAATKELAIENALKGMEKLWESVELEIIPHKDKEKNHFLLSGIDDLYQTLDDNRNTLSNMKTSRFVKPFEHEVDKWERDLSHIQETVEMLLTVQRQWLYLENIFLGEDIRKQLPKESADFDKINKQWRVIMTELNQIRNARACGKKEGLLETFNAMNTCLEDIQKSLDMYLETKRNIFPRFYFISNDDLLEILGQSKNPDKVLPHLKKCFDNINSLKIEKKVTEQPRVYPSKTAKPIKSSKKASDRLTTESKKIVQTNVEEDERIRAVKLMSQGFEASSMFSSDGEEVLFKQKLRLEGPVEAWLCDLEKCMRVTLRDLLRDCRIALKKAASKRDKWIKEWSGQLCITSSQIQWTADVTKALQNVAQRNDKKPLRIMKKKQKLVLEKFSEAIRSNLTKIQRLKINSLVVIEVHQRDIIEKLYKSGCSDINAFEWLSQLRFYWEKEIDDCVIKQTNTSFQYGYEYLGNSGRLVITPLTDRCYITLTTALHLHRGGSPKGPAGTGKTETVKDLGKSLGAYVIVVNCSEGLDYKSMGRMFSGLAQTGAWGCFDEFNRINIEVLSVVAQQILSILSALASNAPPKFMFQGRMIDLVPSVGIFITMNPGYAGRTELPDNLKSMFRPIAMVTPDSAMIAEITLFAEGFSGCKVLAKKVFTLYSLSIQQLSKQDHYDFGLRALVSVLRYAGRKKRANPLMPDEEILLLSMNDMNLAKLTSVDLPLFKGIVSDLFPGIDPPVMDYTSMKEAIEKCCDNFQLQPTKFTITKVVQLYETKTSRHSVMIVGKTLSGKSTTWRLLQSALAELSKEKESQFEKALEFPLNPKSVSLGELYGEFDLNTNEWTDGVLSSVMRKTCADTRPDEKWIIFDGPVDTLWIESMNSVMDDNKILTLINGERISMPEQVSLLFEVEDLSVASPATVSRCGMVYNDVNDLGWRPYVESWLKRKIDSVLVEELSRMFDKYIEKIQNFIRLNCIELICTSPINSVISLCKLFDCLATIENGCDPSDTDNYSRVIELWFQFCMIWSICCSVDEDGRKKIDNYIREMEGTFPNKDTIYEYFVDNKNKSWGHWDEKLKTGWKYNASVPFYKIIVPTVDTVRYNYLVQNLVCNFHPVMLVGPVGTGKTSVAVNTLNQLNNDVWTILTINMSAQTSSNNVQDIIEARVEKRTKDTFVPVGGKRMLTFMDDFNMPAKDTFGSQPPLELIRQWIDYGFWYDRLKQTQKRIKDMYLFVAMGPPGGGRMMISNRLQSRFNLINMTFPTESNLKRIFGSMINQKLQDFEEELKPIGDIITQATIEMYNGVVIKFLPTPTKIHYLFNLRDISKIFQGMLRTNKDYHDTKNSITRLWIHENFRVFADRMVIDKDKVAFVELLSDKLGSLFDQTFHNICPNKQSPIFGDYMSSTETYEDITDIEKLKKFMKEMLDEYNNTPGVVQMDLVLFRDAIEHISKIIRVIRQPRGNMLLVGIGGSGRQSLTRLAAYMCEYTSFQIEVSKHYRKQEFRDDLKRLYWQAGVDNKPTLFLFNDTQVVDESFLEDINNILSSGEIPNLYKQDEIDDLRNQLSDEAKRDGIEDTTQSIFTYLIDRVRGNMHVVLCMSPVGEPFRNRIRMFPAFVNCTTIDWFSEWPLDALLEVAERYLKDLQLFIGGEEDRMKPHLATIFSLMHRSVSDMSQRMLDEMKRHNYVTPTNYLELVSGYKILLVEKRKQLSDSANKLKNGLGKIDETRAKVEIMSIELEEARKKLAIFQKECDDYLVVIVQQKREADDQAKSVMQTQERIKVDEAKCLKMQELALADLAQAMPALEAAMQALESLNKKDITEIKSYGKPPALVQKVMEAVMILRGAEPTWAEAKKHLGEQDFIKQLINFDKDNISDRTLKKIGTYVAQDDFQPDMVGKVSLAAKSLCMWVGAMEVYGRVYRVVEPKRQRLQAAESVLREKQAQLAAAQAKLDAVMEEMKRLQQEYNEKMEQKEELRRKAEHTEKMLDRASKLVSGLAGEKDRWEKTVADLENQIGLLPGDCLIASAFLSYMGPFLSDYREALVIKWTEAIKKEQIPANPSFSFIEFLSNPTQIRDWNIQGLPRDGFSVENGVIVTRGSRWPLMVDPQCQAQKWIKQMEGKKLKVIDLHMPDFIRVLEIAIQFGQPVLLQNVQEKLDPSLDPILNKSIVKIGGASVMKLGDKEIEYNYDFRFYITTKLPNPHYTPEISTKTCIVNFAVKEQGLEAQLLGIVVRKERPELEEQKDNLVMSIAAGKRKLAELEDEILRLLNEAQGSLLDDEQLVNTLQTSKITSTEVTEQLQIAEKTETAIDIARQGYAPCAQRASILFFVLNDLGKIDPMYQFALDAYIDLFNMSINKSTKSPKRDERISNLNDHHTYAVYCYACRGLFEKHKLLFSFQICAKILQTSGKMNMDEYNFFLKGGVVLDRENQMDNPCPGWLSDQAWDNISELDKLANFHGLITSFEQYPRDWNLWYTSDSPETSSLPGEWDNATNEFQRMLIVRSLRPDRVSFCATSFIINNLGNKFVEPPVLDMKQVVDDSSAKTCLIFVLSPGVDPTSGLLQLAESLGMAKKFHALSLGQGQAPIATRMINEGTKEGNWVFLANCHLSLSWMPQLDKIVEELQIEEPDPKFRLWLSSSPHPEFPISILQSGIKMTTEPPKGLKANMKRLYHLIKEDQFSACRKPEKYKKLLFSLCFFHSVLLERRKFLTLGWNIPYEFNDSDFEVSENLLSNYLDQYETTPWDALKYLIADINYGGHVTDDLDRRLLNTYIADYFREEAIKEPFFKLSILPSYYIPRDGSLNSYREFITMLPNIDHPEAFGQHPNADIASQIQETRLLFDTLLSLKPQVVSVGGDSKEDKVLEISGNITKQLPENIDYEGTAKILSTDPCPLNVVLLQEIQRYNFQLDLIRKQLNDLEKGIQGLVVMSSDLEDIFDSIYDTKVPRLWSKAYPSMKPLASWTRDLVSRIEMFQKWAITAHAPKVFWVSAFTFPTGFLTAVIQTSARLNNISVDTLNWDFTVLTISEANIASAPKDGVYVKGLYLQGAGWDMKNSILIEASPMELTCAMPVIHFKPIENKKKSQKNSYICPCYYYPNRAGISDRPSYIESVELKTGEKAPEHWTKRGTALLMSLDS